MNSTSPAKPAARPAEKATNETIKETFESIVIAFVLAFVFRAYVVEAFVIPTGSMAPTLMGQHVNVTCPQCGYRFALDPQEGEKLAGGNALATAITATCPMCNYPAPISAGTRLSYGDRILVHKFLYNLTEPQRWDVVVFKYPQSPDTNFIKRLIGLPGEQLWIIEGNIYTRPLKSSKDDWKIQRKSDRPEVQRAVWQPIYHSQYVPLDAQSQSLGRGISPWALPWVPGANAADWDLKQLGVYRYNSTSPGTLLFDFDRKRTNNQSWYAYNQRRDSDPVGQRLQDRESIEDVRLATLVEPQKPGVSVQLSTTCRLDNPAAGVERLTAQVEANGRVTLLASSADGKVRTLAQVQESPLPVGIATAVELWFVDQQASVWIDGRRVIKWSFDLPIEILVTRPPAPRYPHLSIAVQGAPVILRQVEVDRDLYYSSAQNSGLLATGGLDKNHGEPHGQAVTLENDQFFCMGDNSPLSHDSRYWDQVNPWIDYRMLSNHLQRRGVVPRRLMMGRAFFVYFPAPHRGQLPVPNFGDMRFIH